MQRLGHYCALFVILCASVSGCNHPAERTGPKFTGRLLFLNGNGTSGRDLVELVPDGESYKVTTIAGDITEATASPDQTQLLYTTSGGITLRDLHGGNAKSLVKDDGFCLAWAPDGKHFSYKQRTSGSTKLYVSDLDSKVELIWEDASGAERADDRYCAQWIAPDRLVFDRFGGLIQNSAKAGEAVKPNTTTIRSVGGTAVKGVEFERKWSIQGICSGGSAILAPADQSSPILIAKSVEYFEKLNPISGPSEGRFIGFAAKSCVPFFIQQSTSATTDLFSLNPTNWQQLRSASISYTFTPAAKMLIKSSARLMVVGDAPDKLLLIDTESGDVTSFFPDSTAAPNAGPLLSPVPVVWIEN